jgi:hypothetical protein
MQRPERGRVFVLWSVGARRWMAEAVKNIREGLVPYLATPHFLPLRSSFKLSRSFPTLAELQAMPHGPTGQDLMNALNAWRHARPEES